MPKSFPNPTILSRDGTSQAGRVQPALDPGHAAVDERTPRDWLALVQAMARALRFADPERPGHDLDWRAFLPGDLDLDRVVAYMRDPASVSPSEAERFGRPHFALLLAFLALVGEAQDHLNGLTRRHLEFYFEQVLRMQRKPATPDRVHVLLRPTRGVDGLVLAAGTELAAGKTAAGKPVVYRTDAEVLINRAQVAELRSLYIDQRVTEIREANERRDPGTDRNDRFVRMFAFALGDPFPGDPMPPYAGEPVGLARLVQLGQLARFSAERLYLELYELRSLIQLKQRRADADADWTEINRLLERAGQRRTQNPAWKLAPADPRRFADNLAKALGTAIDKAYFDGLPEVNSIDDLYTQRSIEQRAHTGDEDSDVDIFIRERIFLELADFDAMMALKTRSDGEWRQVNALLERAGQRRRGDHTYRLGPADPTDFAANFAAALVGPGFTWPAWPPGVKSPESYHSAILALEAYFYMSAEALAYITAAAPGGGFEPSPKQWDKIYAMLTAAYQARVYAGRRAALAEIRGEHGFRGMMYAALGVEPSLGESPLPQLKAYLPRAADLAYLAEIEADIAANNGDEAVIADAQWARVVSILEVAQRTREQLPEPRPRRIEWRNLYPQRDATRVTVTVGLASDDEHARWQTFGAKPVAASQDAPPTVGFGWALASPMLALAEGERSVVLTLGFAPQGWDPAKIAAALQAGAFAVEVTTAKGWTAPTSVVVTHGDYEALAQSGHKFPAPLKALRFELKFAVDADPIVAIDPALAGIAAREPALRLAMRQIWDAEAAQYITLYEPFRPLTLQATHLRTGALGLTTLALQNDAGALDPKRPFEPFGSAPAVGSRCLIGHPELVRNRLDSLTLHIAWMGAPANLAAHYANYGLDDKLTNASFTAQLSAVDHRRGFALGDPAPLFASDARKEQTLKLAALPPALTSASDVVVGASVVDWRRYFQLELTPLDFQHGAYGRVANQRALELAAAIAGNQPVTASAYQVNPPYTPKIRRLSVDYTSSVEVILADADLAAGRERLFHVRPFGSHPIAREEDDGAYRFLPAYDDGGELYIGLENVAAPQQLSLLMQMAEGSADPDLEPVPVEWSYLSGDRWLSLHHGDLLSDTTRGLINTGIVALRLPAAAPSTQLPADRYWLRVTIPRLTESVCDVVAIHAQAVSATFVDRGDDPEHYAQPLPAATISGLLRHDPRVGGVEQPYTSFGGRARERAEDFYTRVSERLRHKQRALTLWDYERIVLEQVPRIYKVKCLPADLSEHPDDPGRVELIVIPDIRDKLPFDPFEPKAPADLLADVERLLAPCCPPFATVKARNARYVAIKARFGVRFAPGRDEGFFKKLLNEELCRFLSPWAYAEGTDIAIGGRIYANSVVNFVDQREYVDYVATIKLFRSRNGVDYELVAPPVGDDAEGYFVGTERPDEILVASREHDIDVITDVQYDTELLSGINYMKVELDYVVG